MSENGVTDYREIPNHPQLKALVKKMQMSFKEVADGSVKVYINGEYTSFRAKKSSYESIKIFSDTESVGIIFEIKLKDGRTYITEFTLENGKVVKYGDWEGEDIKKEKINEYELSANNTLSQR